MSTGGIVEALDELAGFFLVLTGSEEEDDFSVLSVGQFQQDLHGGARIQAGSGLAREAVERHRGRPGISAIAAEEFCSIPRQRAHGFTDTDKGRSRGKLAVKVIAGKNRAAGGFMAGDGVHQSIMTPLPQNPFPVTRHREPTRPTRPIAHLQDKKFHRGFHRNIHP